MTIRRDGWVIRMIIASISVGSDREARGASGLGVVQEDIVGAIFIATDQVAGKGVEYHKTSIPGDGQGIIR